MKTRANRPVHNVACRLEGFVLQNVCGHCTVRLKQALLPDVLLLRLPGLLLLVFLILVGGRVTCRSPSTLQRTPHLPPLTPPKKTPKKKTP